VNSARFDLFADLQHIAVTLRIRELKQKGGPTEEDWRWLQGEVLPIFAGERVAVSEAVVAGGEGCAEGFNLVARAVAIMAFVPGGIDWCGCHFEEQAAGARL
jgi:hypothetical protein